MCCKPTGAYILHKRAIGPRAVGLNARNEIFENCLEHKNYEFVASLIFVSLALGEFAPVYTARPGITLQTL